MDQSKLSTPEVTNTEPLLHSQNENAREVPGTPNSTPNDRDRVMKLQSVTATHNDGKIPKGSDAAKAQSMTASDISKHDRSETERTVERGENEKAGSKPIENRTVEVSEPIKHEEGVRQEERRSQVLHEMNESPHAAVFDS